MKKEYKYRVYIETITGGSCYRSFLPDQYEDAKALFDDLVAKKHEAIHLQELDQEQGWTSINLKWYVTKSLKGAAPLTEKREAKKKRRKQKNDR